MKSKIQQTIFAAFVLLTTVLAKTDAEKTAHELLTVSGSGTMGKQVVQQMIYMQKQTNPDVPEEVWEEVVNAVDTDGLLDIVAPAYVQHFTIDEMNEIIAFYKTPTGKKLIEKQPLIMQQTMVASQQWGMELVQKMTTILKEKGYGGENANWKMDSDEFKTKSEKE